jgi:hypothetical protein
MKTVLKKNIVFLTLFFVPIISSAQTFRDLARDIIDLLNLTATFIMGLALLAFVIGAIRFISTSGDDQSRASGKQLMVWGTISLFVMVSVWGIVAIIQTTFFWTMIRILFSLLLFATVPVHVLRAQVTLTTILNMFITLTDVFIRVGAGIAFIVFLWGVVRMIMGMNAGETDAAITEGKQKMIWGIVALFLIVSIWGIVALLITMFGTGITPTATPPIIT